MVLSGFFFKHLGRLYTRVVLAVTDVSYHPPHALLL